MRAFDSEITAAVTVGIDVGDAVGAQFVIVLLGPLGRAQEPRLFAIPRAINNSALRLPTGFYKLPKRTRLFQNSDLAGNRSVRAVDRSVVMVATNRPLIRKSRARNFCAHVGQRL